MGARKGAATTNSQPRPKFRLSSARDRAAPLKGSIHARTITVSENLRRAKETPRVQKIPGEVERTPFDWNPTDNLEGESEMCGGAFAENIEATIVKKRYGVSVSAIIYATSHSPDHEPGRANARMEAL